MTESEELDIAKAFHAEAIAERNLAWAQNDIIKAQVRELKAQVDVYIKQRNEARALCFEVAEPDLRDKCWFDHHGYCQGHGTFKEPEDGPCVYGILQKLVVEWGFKYETDD